MPHKGSLTDHGPLVVNFNTGMELRLAHNYVLILLYFSVTFRCTSKTKRTHRDIIQQTVCVNLNLAQDHLLYEV